MNKNIVILISGRGSNMLAIARNVQSGLLKDKCQIAAVFSNNPDAEGLAAARNLGIPTCCIPSAGVKKQVYNRLLLNWLQKTGPDLIVLAGYMKILSPEIVRAFPGRIINIHPADTALHQGLHGYEWAWHEKLPATRVTVHFVDEGLDTGKIIAQQEVDLTGASDLIEVEERGLRVEHQLYSRVIRDLLNRL
ncbi:MAG: phosphoribosylglycinamide formyltransferase [Candidatus Cloacimonetes bacterium]|nr:phosphoribosylglycinamide formyltransferase [Candidatus Cloacimonadota bacterium]